MDKKELKQWLVRQFLPSRSHARPAGESVEAVAVTVFGFGLVSSSEGKASSVPSSVAFSTAVMSLQEPAHYYY